jgi:hypothetical protein
VRPWISVHEELFKLLERLRSKALLILKSVRVLCWALVSELAEVGMIHLFSKILYGTRGFGTNLFARSHHAELRLSPSSIFFQTHAAAQIPASIP